MNLRAFVSGSAIVLMGWMMVSFLHQSLPQRYQFDRTAEVSETTIPDPAEVQPNLAVTVSSSH